ncbi:hypothetical protein EHQ82_08255, partial [Leptospira selangorensis]
FSQCTNWGNYRIIILEQQKIDAKDVPVKGKSCTYLWIPLYPKLDDAIRDAISKAPDKKALKNLIIKVENYFFVNCFSVTGFASERI